MTPLTRRRIGALALVPVLLTSCALSACATGEARTSIRVFGPWTDDPNSRHDERDAFRSVLDQFEHDYQIKVNYEGTRDVAQALRAGVEEGRPPDVVVLPNAGTLAEYAGNGNDVQALDEELVGPADNGGASHRTVRWGADNRAYAVAIKTAIKSLIWYDPTRVPKNDDEQFTPPQTWSQLLELSERIADTGTAPWCLAVGDTSAPGWPGTDWIEDLLLHQAGPEAYAEWASGELAWTSAPVRKAWSTWGSIAVKPTMTSGGAAAALLTNFADVARPMFDDGQCLLHHQGSFIAAMFAQHKRGDTGLAPGTDFDFFPFPRIAAEPTSPGRRVEVSADFAAQFTPRQEARDLIGYLLSKEAQEHWTEFSGGNVLLAGSRVDYGQYDPVSRSLAGTLAEAETRCLDASDTMPAQMATAFRQAVLEYLNDPDRLDVLLGQLERIRADLADPEDPNLAGAWLTLRCE